MNKEKSNGVLILIVEDDLPVRNLIRTTLEAHGIKNIWAKNGAQAILEASTYNPDVVLLDLGLPDIDGNEIIKKIRTWSDMPIIVISARTDDADKIEALDNGADDYMIKPFSVEELLARIRVTIRRLQTSKQENGKEAVITNGNLKIDMGSGCVWVDDIEVHLTPNEYKLLCVLARNMGKVLTQKYLIEQVWGVYSSSEIPSLRVFMATLRKKIEPDSGNSIYIQTHIGIGYRMLRQPEQVK